MDTRTEGQKALDCEIERITGLLKNESDPSTEDYYHMAESLKMLCEAREKKNPLQIDLNTIIAVGANILGLLIVLNFEKANVITSKAFGMIFKGKSTI